MQPLPSDVPAVVSKLGLKQAALSATLQLMLMHEDAFLVELRDNLNEYFADHPARRPALPSQAPEVGFYSAARMQRENA